MAAFERGLIRTIRNLPHYFLISVSGPHSNRTWFLSLEHCKKPNFVLEYNENKKI
jgi:hypothetical protein